MCKYIILNPYFDKIDEILRKDVNIYNKEYDEYGIRCLIIILTNTNITKYIKLPTRSNMHYSHYIPKKLVLNRTDKEGDEFLKYLK